MADNSWVDVIDNGGDGWTDVGPSVGSDILDTLLPSAAKAVTGIAGAPGDIEHLAKSGISYLLNKAGYGNAAQTLRSSPQTYRTSEGYLKGLTGMTADQMYSPQTTAGQLTDRAIQFAPAMIGGPETVVGKLAADVVPAAASLVGGKVAGPVGEVTGSLVSPLGLKAAVTPGAIKTARNALLTTGETAAEVDSLYAKMRASGVTIKPDAYQRLASDLVNTFKGSNYRLLLTNPTVAAQVHKIVDDAKSAVPISLDDFTGVKTDLGVMAHDPGQNPTDRRLASIAYGKIQDFWKSLKAPDINSNTPSDPTVGLRLKQEADKLNIQLHKQQLLDQFVAMARKKKNVNYSASGDENAIRQQLGKLDEAFIKLDNGGNLGVGGQLPYQAKFFSPAEKQAITKAAEGGPAHNLLRQAGKLSLADRFGQSIAATLGMGGAVTHAALGSDPYAGLLWAGALAAPGQAARHASVLWTRHNLRKALDMIHNNGAPLTYSAAPYPIGLLPPTVNLAAQQAGNQ